MDTSAPVKRAKRGRVRASTDIIFGIFVDSLTRNAIEAYYSRFPGSTKRFVIHRGIEYYTAWKMQSLDLPEDWELFGDPPKDPPASMLVESGDAQKTGYYATVKIDAGHYRMCQVLANEMGVTERNVIMRAVRAFLYDQGFLSYQNEDDS